MSRGAGAITWRTPPTGITPGSGVSLAIVGPGACDGCGERREMRAEITLRAVGRRWRLGLCCAEPLCRGDLLSDEDIARWRQAHRLDREGRAS